jgi:putative transposase
MLRYPRLERDDEPIATRLRELAAQRRRWGRRRLTVMLRREGCMANWKWIDRIYCSLGLQVRRRIRKRIAYQRGEPLVQATRPNQGWSMDFVHDALDWGRRYRILTVVDDFAKHSPTVDVDTSLPSQRVIRALERASDLYGAYPRWITVDNGPEFTSIGMLRWSARHDIELRHIAPGKPIQNAFIESFNGKLRDECLYEYAFTSIDEARREIVAWHHEYNELRPHAALDNRTPLEFALAALTPMLPVCPL